MDTGIEQAARLIGTYGLGAIAILLAGAVLAVIRRWHWAEAWLAVVALIAVGVSATTKAPPATSIPITVVQPNIGQGEKYDPALERDNFLKLARLSAVSSDAPRLLFWPEAAIYAILDMEPAWRARIASLLEPGSLLMTGGDKYHFKPGAQLVANGQTLAGANNSLWVLSSDARIRSRYDKAHLVPYGEYLPMRTVLSAIGLSRLVPGDVDFWPGPGPRSLNLPPAPGRPAMRMAVQICYEIIFSGQVVDRGARPSFLFNPSNDSWFGAWGPPQHLAQARMRAVEEGLPVIRSTPTGVSAVVDARGRIVASIGPHRAGAINVTLPAAAPATPFANYGNLLPLLLAALLLASGVALMQSKR